MSSCFLSRSSHVRSSRVELITYTHVASQATAPVLCCCEYVRTCYACTYPCITYISLSTPLPTPPSCFYTHTPISMFSSHYPFFHSSRNRAPRTVLFWVADCATHPLIHTSTCTCLYMYVYVHLRVCFVPCCHCVCVHV